MLSVGVGVLHELAWSSVGTVAAYRLVLGRCLLAFELSKAYRVLGCSSAIHYGMSRLGLTRRQALCAKRVAKALCELPLLTEEAEKGTISWSKLREIVRKAVPETEAYWIQLADERTSDEIQYLVSVTPDGELPGQVACEQIFSSTELRCRLEPGVFRLLTHSRRALSIQLDRAVTMGETLEWMSSAYLASEPLDEAALARLRKETDKDLAAEKARLHPLVDGARELAQEMGLLEPDLEEQEGRPGWAEVAFEDEPGVPDLEQREACQTEASTMEARCSASEERYSQVGTPEFFEGPSLEGKGGGIDGLVERVASELSVRTGEPMTAELLESALGGPAPFEVVVRQPEEPGRVPSPTGGYAFWKNGRLRFNPKSRRPTGPQRKEILRRDGYRCSTPGCPHFCWLHIHHIEPYARGGGTVERNLVCLCTRCHKNVHDGYLRIERGKNDELVFLDQEGRRLDHAVKLALANWVDVWLGAKSESDTYGGLAQTDLWPLPLASGQAGSSPDSVGVGGDWSG